MMIVSIDPGGSSHSHPLMAPHPLSLRANMDTVVTPEQILSYGPPRGRAEICPSGPPLQSLPPGAHQFHSPQGWLEVHPRGGGASHGMGGGGGGRPGQHSAAAAHPQPTGIPQTGGPPRRSPRAGGPVFRSDFPPQHHHMHPPPPPQQHGRQHHPSSGGGGGGSGAPLSASDQFMATQQRRVGSPRNGGCGGGALVVGPPSLQQQQQQQQRSQTMRAGGPGAGAGGLVCGPRRRPEHLHLVGPLGEPMFVGSPTAVSHGGGGGGGEGNTGPETVSRVLIPNCKIGAVIGKGGAIIKHIREVRGRLFAAGCAVSGT